MAASGSFSAQIRNFGVKTEAKAVVVIQKTALEIHARIVDRSPVDTGRFRGNWQVGVGFVPSGEAGADKSGGAVKAGAFSSLSAYELGKTIYIVNNLPYGPVLEYGLYPNPPKGGKGKTIGGFSTQAPAGMVGITLKEFSRIVSEIAR